MDGPPGSTAELQSFLEQEKQKAVLNELVANDVTMKAVNLKQLSELLRNGGRLVGLDVGQRNVGVAISDHRCRVASPHSVLYRNQSTNLQNVDTLDNLVKRNSVAGLVVGYPLELAGHRSSQERMVKTFINELHLSGRFPDLHYIYWDERLTSVAMTRTLASLEIGGLQRKNIIDKMAALGILQDCLDCLSRLERGSRQ